MQQIMAFELQLLGLRIEVPNLFHISKETILALVDFHQCKYTWPASYSTLAHHLLAADSFGDDSFIEHIAHALKVPPSRLNGSHTPQVVKMAVRD